MSCKLQQEHSELDKHTCKQIQDCNLFSDYSCIALFQLIHGMLQRQSSFANNLHDHINLIFKYCAHPVFQFNEYVDV